MPWFVYLLGTKGALFSSTLTKACSAARWRHCSIPQATCRSRGINQSQETRLNNTILSDIHKNGLHSRQHGKCLVNQASLADDVMHGVCGRAASGRALVYRLARVHIPVVVQKLFPDFKDTIGACFHYFPAVSLWGLLLCYYCQVGPR